MEAVVAELRYCPGIWLQDWWEPQKTSERIAAVPAEIGTKHIPNTSLERYC
jgi:hypothetical protein